MKKFIILSIFPFAVLWNIVLVGKFLGLPENLRGDLIGVAVAFFILFECAVLYILITSWKE